ncbi:hypothetical protein NXT3_CH01077 [Sinorhizobium fredii]|uniref:Uncharacterized protein n=1 Tax=Rhizobium fredii TaxID=380 RepID=A0A2L0H2F8_RHIFR|nr:hypothetical protein NXT3_CH01077 [Sinorhizobium fredii]
MGTGKIDPEPTFGVTVSNVRKLQGQSLPRQDVCAIGTGLRVLDIVSIHDCRRTNGER